MRNNNDELEKVLNETRELSELSVHSISIEDVLDNFRHVFKMYSKDAALKSAIAQDVVSASGDACDVSRDDMLLEMSAWSVMPYVNDECVSFSKKKVWVHEMNHSVHNN